MNRAYHPRLKQAIIESGNPDLFPQLKIPRSTASGWIRNGVSEVVTIPEAEFNDQSLLIKNQELKKELSEIKAKHELSWTTFRMFGYQIQYQRIDTIELKKHLIKTIKQFTEILSLNACLQLIGLSAARYHIWVKSLVECNLEGIKHCVRTSTNRLTQLETSKIKEYLSDSRFFHFSITSLAIYAKKMGDVYASPMSWHRLARKWKLGRKRKRTYPAKPKVGIRANGPNEIWHIDQTIMRLRSGARVYIQSVIDNYSRMVLATRTTLDFGGVQTKTLLQLAIVKAHSLGKTLKPNLISDKGSENINSEVQSMIPTQLTHQVAQIDIKFSNSMVESFFRKLKNDHLYFKNMDSLEDVSQEVDYYIQDHNEIIPLKVLNSATPLESYTEIWTEDNNLKIIDQQNAAIASRILTNRELRCGICPN